MNETGLYFIRNRFIIGGSDGVSFKRRAMHYTYRGGGLHSVRISVLGSRPATLLYGGVTLGGLCTVSLFSEAATGAALGVLCTAVRSGSERVCVYVVRIVCVDIMDIHCRDVSNNTLNVLFSCLYPVFFACLLCLSLRSP